MTDRNQRVHIRNKLRARIKLIHPSVGELELKTADISDGGAYIFADGHELPDAGELVTVQVLGLGGGDGPEVKMKIVRVDDNGVGLQFV